MKEIKLIIKAFERTQQQGQKTALATVVHVEGSSYRASGARMLITEDGLLTGAISGGCLEEDALRKALMVIMQDQPLLVTYHTTDEDNAFLGINLGCNGTIRVLIEPVHPENPQNPIALLKIAVHEKSPAVLVTLFSLKNYRDVRQGTRLLVKNDFSMEEKTIFPNANSNGELPSYIREDMLNDIKKVFKAAHSLFINYNTKILQRNGTGGYMDHELSAFLEYVKPDISLVIAGAGNDIFPVVQMAELMG